VWCRRIPVTTEARWAPADQGAATRNSNAISRSRNAELRDAQRAEWYGNFGSTTLGTLP
jgi:hypothetical protein